MAKREYTPEEVREYNENIRSTLNLLLNLPIIPRGTLC